MWSLFSEIVAPLSAVQWLTVAPPLYLFTGYVEVRFCAADSQFLSTEYLCFYLAACISNVSPKSALTSFVLFFFVLGSCFCRYCIMTALRRPLMHSKCHNVIDPVTQNDYLALVSNALSSIYALWDVVLMFMCVSVVWTNKHHLESGFCPYAACGAGTVARLCLDRVFRCRAEIMNWLICRGRFRGAKGEAMAVS